ncbi:hypothetical protein [Actinokineospora bangkokensis]|uniref:hypothetical protein n=1 Tax=Actinokineospora bangkokensis TaxID=1193682 RepID=UPI000ACF2ECB|nr:hypothetical protein [Actinokineospora bangkokensis]
MPRVQQHRRRLPGSWFRTTSVRSHYRKSPALIPTIIAVVLALVLLAVLIF